MNKLLTGFGRLMILSALLLLARPCPAASVQAVDHSLWGELLKKHVEQGLVDYNGFKADEKILDRYLNLLESIDPDSLHGPERYAFFINIYNAWTIKLILTRWPGLNSIKEAGSIFSSPWKKKIVRLKTGLVTLDNVEHDILRPESQDPRIHFAVNCASKGCPPLAAEPFSGENLEEQLDKVARDFINDPQKTRLEGERLFLNKIFSWYGEDFGDKAGFVLKYAEGEFRTRLLAVRDKVKISFLNYNWSLNKRPPN